MDAGVEGLDIGVVGRCSGPGEVQLDAVQVGPLVQHPTGELRAVVHPNALWLTPLADQAVENLDNIEGSEVGSRNRCEPSREQQSTMVRSRNGRPSNKASEMKSIAHTSFGAAISGRPVL